MSTIGVIGAGPAGMMAALTAAKTSNNKIILFDTNDRVGKKILATGNGKCNLSNTDMGTSHFYSDNIERVEACLSEFSVNDTINFFESLGVVLKDKGGYLYPNSEQASTILDALRFELERQNITFVSEFKVLFISKSFQNDKFVIESKDRKYTVDKVILACGSKAAPKTGSDGTGYILAQKLGHNIVDVVPALVQLICSQNFMKSVSGVRCQATITAFKDNMYKEFLQMETGELQLTDYGISGIPVFQLSRIVNKYLLHQKEVFICIDFLPTMDQTAFEKMIQIRENSFLDRTAEEYYFGILNKKITLLLLKYAGLKPTDPIQNFTKEKRHEIFALMRKFPLTVIGNKGFDNAQVCAGGVDLDEVTERLESKLHSGLYLAGELLDVDGRCGGYNLQWAFTSGFIAGKAASTKDT